MSLRKVRFYAVLATIFALAPAGESSLHVNQFYEREMSAWLGRSLPDKSLRATRRVVPAVVGPVQFKDPERLATGKLLVASRGLGDPHFAKTVILLVQYDAKGVVGLVLNHRTDVPLSRVLGNLKAAKDRSDPAYLGGPLDMGTVFGLLRSAGKVEGAEKMFDGVYLISEKTLFEQTIAGRPNPDVFHVYVGYAGWTQDQLRKEVELGAWFVFPAEADAVFNSDPGSLWPEMIRKTELKFARSERENADQLARLSYR